MQRTFITNLFFLLLLNIVVKGVWLFVDVSVQKATGAAEYGNYFALLNFTFLMNFLLDFGITNFNNRNIARHHQLVSKHLTGIMGLKILLGVVYILMALVCGLLIGYDSGQMKILGILCFNQFLVSFIAYQRSNLTGLHLFRSDSVMSVLDRLLMIVICGFLLASATIAKPFQIEWFVYAQTAAYFTTAIIVFILVLSRTGMVLPSWNMPFTLMILRKSYPYAILVLLMTFYNRVDSVMLERMLDDGSVQSGIYAHGFRILDALNMIAVLFAVLLLPMFARMLKRGKSTVQLVSLSFRLLFAVAMLVSVNCFFHAEELMGLLYDVHIAESGVVFGLLILGFIPIATSYIFGTLLTANGSLKQLNLIAGVGIIVNVSLNLLLIPKLQAYGCAIASLITQSITAGIQVVVAFYVLKFSVSWRLVSRLAIYVTAAAFIGWFFQLDQISMAANVALSVLASMLLAFMLKLVDLRALQTILRERVNPQ